MEERIQTPCGDLTIFIYDKGYYDLATDSVIGADNVEKSIYKNMIVTSGSVLIANRMRPGASWGKGIEYLAVGSSAGTGTLQKPEPGDPSYNKLRAEFFRKYITSWTYLDENKQPSVTETNWLRYVFTFGPDDAVGNIVELGLFGGDATDILDSGHMFNYKAIPYKEKQQGKEMTIAWNIRY